MENYISKLEFIPQPIDLYSDEPIQKLIIALIKNEDGTFPIIKTDFLEKSRLVDLPNLGIDKYIKIVFSDDIASNRLKNILARFDKYCGSNSFKQKLFGSDYLNYEYQPTIWISKNSYNVHSYCKLKFTGEDDFQEDIFDKTRFEFEIQNVWFLTQPFTRLEHTKKLYGLELIFKNMEKMKKDKRFSELIFLDSDDEQD